MQFKDVDVLKLGHTIQLTGAIYTGEGKSYICLLPDETLLPTEVLYMDQEDWKNALQQTDLLNVEVVTQGPNGEIGKAIVRKSQRQIDAMISWEVFRRDGFECRYCGCDFMPLTVDHLILWEEGGPSVPENLVAACKKCNKVRGNKQYADWLNDPFYKIASANLTEVEKSG